MRGLVITEKPSVMFDLKKYYERNGYSDSLDFSCAVGHLVTLKYPGEYKEEWKEWRLDILPIIPNRFEYKVIEESKAAFEKLKKDMTNDDYDYFINACDAGREGELIFNSIYSFLNLKKPVKRLWLKDATDKGILSAFNDLKDSSEYKNLLAAAKCRQYFDWLIGINLTVALCTKSQNSTISVGRVMTPTLAIIVKREHEIMNFKPTPYWEIEADFEKYKGIWIDTNSKESRILDKNKALSIKSKLENKQGIILSIDKKENNTKPPSLHSLDLLQKEANQLYGYTLGETLGIAQKLYEKRKLITYPRTESCHLSSNLANDIYEHLDSIQDTPGIEIYVKSVLSNSTKIDKVMKDKNYVDDSKVSDHHAIIPTNLRPDFSTLTPEEINIYTIVAKRFLSIFMNPYKTSTTTIITEVVAEQFITKATIILDEGFKVLYKNNKTDDLNISVNQGDSLKIVGLEILDKETKPPQRFNDGSLLDAMLNVGNYIDEENLSEEERKKIKSILKQSKGIGTPATRAAIVEKLVKREMIERIKNGKNNIFKPTELGMVLIKSLSNHSVVSPELTADWEEKLQKLQNNNYSPQQLYKEMIEFTHTATSKMISNNDIINIGRSERVTTPIGTCPKCGKTVRIYKDFYVCEDYKKGCDYIFKKELLGVKIKSQDYSKFLKGEIIGPYSFTFSKGESSAFIKYNFEEQKLEFVFDHASKYKPSEEELGECPLCKNKVFEKTNYYMCENYPNECKFIFSKVFKGASISSKNMRDLLSGKTIVKNFVWKSGNASQAKLKLEEGKPNFSFD